jgi:hypothetical protein
MHHKGWTINNLFFFGENSYSAVTQKKMDSTNSFFGKNAKKSPYFEEK